MNTNFDEVIEGIKQANPIEEVVKELGFEFRREAGKYRKAEHSGGLVVNVHKQTFFWVEKSWNGDVIELVMKGKGFDFRTAAEWLADRAGVERPGWAKMDEKAVKAHRLKLSVFEIAQGIFTKWLWEDCDALDYLKRRGFTDQLIRESGIGFSGRKTEQQFKEMRGELAMYEIDPTTPAAVAVTGFHGDIFDWGHKQGVDVIGEKWIEWSTIPGMMGKPGIVYAHQWGGRVIYFSRRNLPGFDEEVKNFNPPEKLVGKRQPYFNHVYRSDAEECVLVEGPADAETFSMWGIASVALCGVHAEDEGIASLKSRLKSHKKKYLLLDDDKTGRAKRERVAQALDPLMRIVDWSELVNGPDNSEESAECGGDAEGKETDSGDGIDE